MNQSFYYRKNDHLSQFRYFKKKLANTKIIYERKDGKPLNFREDNLLPQVKEAVEVAAIEPLLLEQQSTDTSYHETTSPPLMAELSQLSNSEQFTLGETLNNSDIIEGSQQSLPIDVTCQQVMIHSIQPAEKWFSKRNYKKWLKKQVIAENLRIKQCYKKKLLGLQESKSQQVKLKNLKIFKKQKNSPHSSLNESDREEKTLCDTSSPLEKLPQFNNDDVKQIISNTLPPPMMCLIKILSDQFFCQEKTIHDIITSLIKWGGITRNEIRLQLLINQNYQRNYYLKFKIRKQRLEKEQIEKDIIQFIYLGSNSQFDLIKLIIILKIETEQLIQIEKKKRAHKMNNSSSFEQVSSLSKQQRSLINEKISTRVKELSQNKRTNFELIQNKVDSLISLISTVIDEVSINEIALLQNLMDYAGKDPIWKKNEPQSQSTNCSKLDRSGDQLLANISGLYDNSQEDSSILDMRSRIWEPTGSKLHSDLTYQEKATLSNMMQKELENVKTPISFVKRKLFSSVIDFFSTQQIAEVSWKETLRFLGSSTHQVLEKQPPGDIIYFEYSELTSPHQKLFLVCDLSKTNELRYWLDGQMIREILVPPQFSRTSNQISISIDKKSARQVLNQMILALPINLEQVPARATKFYSNFTLPVALSEQIYGFQQDLLNRNFEKVVIFYDQYFNQLSRIAGNSYTMIISNSINPYCKNSIITLSKPIQLEPGKGQHIDTLSQTDQRFYIEQYNVRETDIVVFPKCRDLQATLKNTIQLDPTSQFLQFFTKIWIENRTNQTIKVQQLSIELNI